MNQDRVIGERFQNGLCGDPLFLDRSVGGQALAIHPLDQEVQREREHQQEHQGFDAFRRVQIHGVHGQRALEDVVDLFTVALLLEFRKKYVGAGLRRRHGRHQRRVAVVLFVVLHGGGGEVERDAPRILWDWKCQNL